MPDFPISLLPQVKYETISHAFSDPAAPGAAFPFSFTVCEATSEADLDFFRDLCGDLHERYVTRNMPLLTGNGLRIPVSRALIMDVANFMAAENLSGTLNTWPAENWLFFAFQCPSAWRNLKAWFIGEERRVKGIPEAKAEGDPDETEAPALKNA